MLPLRFTLMNNFFCYGLTERILWHVWNTGGLSLTGIWLVEHFFAGFRTNLLRSWGPRSLRTHKQPYENVHRCTRTSLSRELWKTVEESGIPKTWNHSEYNSCFEFWKKTVISVYTVDHLFFFFFFLFFV